MRRSGPLAPTLAILGVLVVVVTIAAQLWTEVLWFDSVDVHDVYGTILSAQILLFLVFGVLTAVAVAASLIVVIRQRPPFRPDPDRDIVGHPMPPCLMR